MTDDLRRVAVLYARRNSIYKQMPGCDVWDEDRDARAYTGTLPVVAHPPCARWSMLNGVVLARYPHKAAEFAWGNDGGLFAHALSLVRRLGGVLEHPAQSRAFNHHRLPRPGRGPDEHGGWSCEVRQVDWGHRAEKRTWLYVVGVGPDSLPALPAAGAAPRARVARMASCGRCELMGSAERERTPPAFAEFLVRIARASEVRQRAAA